MGLQKRWRWCAFLNTATIAIGLIVPLGVWAQESTGVPYQCQNEVASALREELHVKSVEDQNLRCNRPKGSHENTKYEGMNLPVELDCHRSVSLSGWYYKETAQIRLDSKSRVASILVAHRTGPGPTEKRERIFSFEYDAEGYCSQVTRWHGNTTDVIAKYLYGCELNPADGKPKNPDDCAKTLKGRRNIFKKRNRAQPFNAGQLEISPSAK